MNKGLAIIVVALIGLLMLYLGVAGASCLRCDVGENWMTVDARDGSGYSGQLVNPTGTVVPWCPDGKNCYATPPPTYTAEAPPAPTSTPAIPE